MQKKREIEKEGYMASGKRIKKWQLLFLNDIFITLVTVSIYWVSVLDCQPNLLLHTKHAVDYHTHFCHLTWQRESFLLKMRLFFRPKAIPHNDKCAILWLN